MSYSIRSEVNEILAARNGSYINGAPVFNGTDYITLQNPSSEAYISTVAVATGDDVDLAVQTSRAAFVGTWKVLTPYQRSCLISKLADLMERDGEIIAQLDCLTTGKNINLAHGLEVGQAAVFLRYFAGWATKLSGETVDTSLGATGDSGFTAYTSRAPVGVVAAILPWNFSVMIGIWKVGAALATGNTVIVKPSEYSPLAWLYIARLAEEAGIPPGVINVVNGNGATAATLVTHSEVRKITFTGSAATGEKVAIAAAKNNFKRVTLELGGKNSAAILPDVSVSDVLPKLLPAALLHQGQICASPERIFIPRAQLAEALECIKQILPAFPVGDAMDPGAFFGPLANEAHLGKVLAFYDKAKAQGRLVFGGQRLPRPGFFVEPLVVIVEDPDAGVFNEECFGPVLCVMAYDSIDELIVLMNSTPYGLTNSIWTNDLKSTQIMTKALESGTVFVNTHSMMDPALPFGGTKGSGYGREFGSAFIDDYTELRSVLMAY